jgi:hypothetical protein
MKNNFSTSVIALFFAVGIAIVASSKAAALDFIYCLTPDGSVRALSLSYSSDCSGFVPPGSIEINETRAKALFEQERLRALGLDNEQLLETQGGSQSDSDNQPGKIQGSGTGASQ